jgi:hypothetical protein
MVIRCGKIAAFWRISTGLRSAKLVRAAVERASRTVVVNK